jgi:hypothetical protein
MNLGDFEKTNISGLYISKDIHPEFGNKYIARFQHDKKRYVKVLGFTKKDDLTINSVSIRYINVIEIDEDNPASRLIQLYPKQSSDRNIINFQNSTKLIYVLLFFTH